MNRRDLLRTVALAAYRISSADDGMPSDRWWPIQKVPKGVIKTAPAGTPNQMLAQSLAGLAARAVNQGTLDEMVWVRAAGAEYEEWYAGMLKRLHLEERGTLTPWDLAARFKDKGVYKGYILYRTDDESSNVATTLAGLMDAILIEEKQEEQARRMGLARLFDARGRDMAWCFGEYREKLSRRIMATIDPKWANGRAMVIANQCAVVYDVGETTRKVAEWVNPPAAVMGWNSGGESVHTGLVTDYGHFQTASNHAQNLGILSAGTEKAAIPRIKTLDPGAIDRSDKRHLVSFLMSDGDNLSFLMANFFSQSYWGNPANGKFAFGWTTCLCHLAQVCPETLQRLARTQPDGVSLVEQGGGYCYPDLLARKRPNRPEVLARQGRLISAQLNKSGGHVLSFICKDVGSEGAREAYEIYAREIDNLIGMIAVQYYPYDGGHGRVFWVKNRKGTEIPVVTLTHSIWNHAKWPTGGSPAKIARLINENAERTRFSFVSVHAWSWFREAEETEQSPGQGASRGLTPVNWCVARLGRNVKVVSPEELIWRLRMERLESRKDAR